MIPRSTLLLTGAGLATVAIVVGAACSPAVQPRVVAKPTAPPAVPDAGKVEPAGARWALDLSDPTSASTKLAISKGSTLFVGDSGERWLSKDGTFESAQTLLPEGMAGVQKTGDGYRFVGSSGGAAYVTHEPLGPATKTSDGVKDARAVAVGKAATLVVDAKGDLLRTVDGKSWAKVSIPQQAGVVVHLAMHDVQGMLVVAPQRIYGSNDDGLTWTPARSPGVGVKDVAVVGDALQLVGKGGERFRFNPAWATFTKATAPSSSHSDDEPSTTEESSLELKQRLVDGGRALEIHSDSSGNDTTWAVSVGPVGGQLEHHAVPELTKCEYVNADMMGDTVELTCDMEGDLPRPDGGITPHSLGYLTKVFRSDDAGKTFHLETTLEGGEPEKEVNDEIDAPVALGAGGLVYLGRRCVGRECLPARARASASSAWVELGKEEGKDDEDAAPLRHLRFARNGSSLFSVGIFRGEGQLYRWKNGQPEALGVVSHEADATSFATLSVDDDGTARGFVADTTKFWRSFEWHEGAPAKYYDLPSSEAGQAFIAAFAGKHGFALGRDAYETSDGGKTWAHVLSPSSLSVVTMCSAQACVATRGPSDLVGGYRIGWDEASGKAAEKPKESPTPQYAKPLRCTTKDAWISLGSGTIPTVGNLGHGATRWMLPVRSNGAVSLVSNNRGDAPTKTSSLLLIDAPSAKYAQATTETYAQDGGFVAVRYASVNVSTTGAAKKKKVVPLPPFDVTVAWFHDGSPKAFKATPPPLTTLTGDVHNADYVGATYMPEVVTLSPKGVYFHPQVDPSEDVRPLYLLRDDGKSDSSNLPTAAPGRPSQVSAAGTPMTLIGSTASGNYLGHFVGAIEGRPNVIWSVSAGLPRSAAAVDLFDFGGKPTFVTTFRGGGYPASAWATPVGTAADLLPSTPLPTQKSLGDVPKACDAASFADTKAIEFNAPYVHGSRHPVVVEIDGVAQVLASEHMRLRVNASGDACVVAMFAGRTTEESDEDSLAVLAFPDDIANAMLFRTTEGVGASAIPRLSMRPVECTYIAAPLPPELEGAAGFEP